MRLKKKKGMFFGVTMGIAMAAAAVLLLLCYVSAYVNPVRFWLMTIFGLLFFPMVLLNSGLLLWALIRRSLLFLIPLIVLLPSVFLIGRYYRCGRGRTAEEGQVKVLSYNVGNFLLSQDGMAKRECMDSIVHFIRREDADIVCLQEFALSPGHDTRTFLQKKFPGYRFIYGYGSRISGNVTLSKFPIRNKGIFRFEKSANLAIFCDCEVRGHIVRIYNCHFESYSISLSRLAQDFRKDYKRTVRGTESKLKRGISRRPKQVDRIMTDIQRSPYKSLIAGDFNDSPMSYTYHKLMRYQKDSFLSAGRGFGATYSLLWPLLRIDYILYPSFLRAVTHETVKKKFSDHYPIVATFDYQ